MAFPNLILATPCPSLLRFYRDLDLTAAPRGLVREGSLDIVVDHAPPREVYVILLTDVILFTQMREGNYLLKCPGKTLNGRSKNPVLRLKGTHVRPEGNHKGIIIISKVDERWCVLMVVPRQSISYLRVTLVCIN